LAGGFVADKGVVLPAVPESGDHLVELLGPAVALGVADVLVPAEILRFSGVIGSHQVPPGPATGKVVQGREFTCYMVRYVIARSGGGNQPNMGCNRTEGREQRQGLKVVRTGHSTGDLAAICSDTVGNEQGIELRCLGDQRQLFVRFKV
jgi:hypothetical protein